MPRSRLYRKPQRRRRCARPSWLKQSAPVVPSYYSTSPAALAGPVAIEKAAFQGWCLRLKTEDESLTRRKRLMTPLSETGKGRSHGLLITKSGVHSHHTSCDS
ncbi:hypothetical protein AAFF_G00370080 [Aldrovandia affinis]|uniref:Uncharacterized protein n=1 Tax=Aldrovandia affinis TaxID=143900 RepID=A0AAD7SGN3_9TELE|nr:hypothetical protein AAFF_G00370080 [Aldrovandia affinis]